MTQYHIYRKNNYQINYFAQITQGILVQHVGLRIMRDDWQAIVANALIDMMP